MDVKGDKDNTNLPVCTLFKNSTSNENFDLSKSSVTDGKKKEEEKLISCAKVDNPPLCNVFSGSHSESQERDLFMKALENTEVDSSDDLSKSSKPDYSANFHSLALSSSMDAITFQDQDNSEIIDNKVQDDLEESNDEMSEVDGLTIEFNETSADDETKTLQADKEIVKENLAETEVLKEETNEKETVAVEVADDKLSKISSTTYDNIENNDIIEETIYSEKAKTPIDLKSNENEDEIITSQAQEVEDNIASASAKENVEESVPIKNEEPVFAPTATSSLFPEEDKNSSPMNIFGAGSINDTDDPFAQALCSSVQDRRQDAWFPSDKTRAILSAIMINQKRIQLEASRITKPGLHTSENLENPSKKLLTQLTGSEAVVKQNQLSANSVPADKDGIRQLIKSGNLRAAVNLCRNLLTEHGQGFGKATQPSINTPDSLQLWFTRLALLVKLNETEIAAEELKQFGELDNPDMYYEFYPDLYPGRKGSMAPFSFRVLHADFPNYIGNHQQALDRLHKIISITEQITKNLQNGKTELGESITLKDEDKNTSIKFWQKRRVGVLLLIGNTLIKMKEYSLGIETYEKVMQLCPEKVMSLQSGIGRILLQIGDIRGAQSRFALAEKSAKKKDRIQLMLNNGFMYAGANNWKDAFSQFEKVLAIDPHNAVALNNKAVCLLYMGQLKNSVGVLEMAMTDSPRKNVEHKLHDQSMQENLLSNLSTLYELESSRFIVKKRTVFIKHVAPQCTDSFNVACFKEI